MDVVFLVKVNLGLAKLLEEGGLYEICASNLQSCIDRIELFRNKRLARGVDSKRDSFLPFSLTCSARKMKIMTTAMKESYVRTKNQINREIRLRDRQLHGGRALEAEEVAEEEFETLESQ